MMDVYIQSRGDKQGVTAGKQGKYTNIQRKTAKYTIKARGFIPDLIGI
jgi:hypothetical protein